LPQILFCSLIHLDEFAFNSCTVFEMANSG
jgi:hypothetical protein